MEKRFERSLGKGEEVLWSDRPSLWRYGWYNRISVIVAGGFVAIPLMAILHPIWTNPRNSNALYEIAFGVCMIILGSIVAAIYYARRTTYILTNRRAVRITNYWRRRVDSTSISEIGFCEADISAAGVGHIFYKISFKESLQEGQYHAGLYPEGFIAIKDARRVKILLQGLLEKSGS